MGGRRPKPYRPPPNLARFDRFSFRLPWPVSANRIWRSVGRRVLLSQEARLYTATVATELLAQRTPCNYLGSPLAVHILQHATSARGDVDNGIKGVLDCLKHFGVIHDDRRKIVKCVTAEDGDRSKVGWVLVTVSPYQPPSKASPA